MENNQKQCGNCRYFSEFYVKYNCRFIPTNCGRCILKRVDCHLFRGNNPACNNWENREILLQERRQSINKAILNISKKLSEIAAVLTDKE